MKRRDALTALAGLAFLAPPPPVLGQPASKARRMGWLVTGFGDSPSEGLDGAFAALRGRGWVPGTNIAYEIRKAQGNQTDLLDRYARELARLDVDVLVTIGEPATEAAMRATSTIPIVFFAAGDPVKEGFVSNLNRPTGNVTGYSTLAEEQRVKRLEALRELVPQVRTIAALVYGPRTPESPKLEANPVRFYAQLGIRLIFSYAANDAETDSAIDAAARRGADALLLPGVAYGNAPIIAAAAIRNRLPSFGLDPKLVESGVLLSLSADRTEQLEMVADLVDRILRGSRPPDLAVRRATRFETVVNAKTARALGIRIPPSLSVRARMVE